MERGYVSDIRYIAGITQSGLRGSDGDPLNDPSGRADKDGLNDT